MTTKMSAAVRNTRDRLLRVVHHRATAWIVLALSVVLAGLAWSIADAAGSGYIFGAERSQPLMVALGGLLIDLLLLFFILGSMAARHEAATALARDTAEAVKLGEARFLAQFQDLSERRDREFEALAIKTLELIEQERTRLSRELHDEVGQTLAALTLALDRVSRVCGLVGVDSSLGQARAITAQLVTTVRELAHRLRPSQLDALGLVAALRWHIDKVMRPLGTEINFAQNIGELRLPAEVESCLFRVAQEALTNVVRHARATAVTVALFLHGDRLTLLIGDDGVGFDMSAYDRHAGRGTLGLLGMRERVAALDGHFEIRSRPREGTEIRASFILLT